MDESLRQSRVVDVKQAQSNVGMTRPQQTDSPNTRKTFVPSLQRANSCGTEGVGGFSFDSSPRMLRERVKQGVPVGANVERLFKTGDVDDLKTLFMEAKTVQNKRSVAKNIANDQLKRLLSSDMFSVEKHPSAADALRKMHVIGENFMNLSHEQIDQAYLQKIVKELLIIKSTFPSRSSNSPVTNFLLVVSPFIRQAFTMDYVASSLDDIPQEPFVTGQDAPDGRRSRQGTAGSGSSQVLRKHSSIDMSYAQGAFSMERLLEDFQDRWAELQRGFAERKRAASMADDYNPDGLLNRSTSVFRSMEHYSRHTADKYLDNNQSAKVSRSVSCFTRPSRFDDNDEGQPSRTVSLPPADSSAPPPLPADSPLGMAGSFCAAIDTNTDPKQGNNTASWSSDVLRPHPSKSPTIFSTPRWTKTDSYANVVDQSLAKNVSRELAAYNVQIQLQQQHVLQPPMNDGDALGVTTIREPVPRFESSSSSVHVGSTESLSSSFGPQSQQSFAPQNQQSFAPQNQQSFAPQNQQPPLASPRHAGVVSSTDVTQSQQYDSSHMLCRICEEMVSRDRIEEHIATCVLDYREFYCEQRLERIQETLSSMIGAVKDEVLFELERPVASIAEGTNKKISFTEFLQRKLAVLKQVQQAAIQVEELCVVESPKPDPDALNRDRGQSFGGEHQAPSAAVGNPDSKLKRSVTSPPKIGMPNLAGDGEPYPTAASSPVAQEVPHSGHFSVNPKEPRRVLQNAHLEVLSLTSALQAFPNTIHGQVNPAASVHPAGPNTRNHSNSDVERKESYVITLQVVASEKGELANVISLIQDVLDILSFKVELIQKYIRNSMANNKSAEQYQNVLSRITSFRVMPRGNRSSTPTNQRPGTGTPSSDRRFSAPAINDFDILKPISRGAYGRVFLATKKRTGDLYAVKILDKAEMMRKNQVAHIMAERNVMARANCPYVVKLYFSFQNKHRLFLVMEFVHGGDLLTLLQNCGSLDESVVKQYAAEIVVALKYLHDKMGVCHRDLKPDNILLDKQGHIKLTDFGLSPFGVVEDLDLSASLTSPPRTPTSRYAPAHHESMQATDLRHSRLRRHYSTDTKTMPLSKSSEEYSRRVGIGQFTTLQERRRKLHSRVGTPDYMAPEILLGTGHDVTCDWWSLGVIIYELFCGFPPFNDDSPDKIFRNILNLDLIPIPETVDMSSEAVDLIASLLVLEPHDRLGAKGAKQIQRDPFFQGIDFGRLERGEFNDEDAPFVPQLESEVDTSYFGDNTGSKDMEVFDDFIDSECSSSSSESDKSVILCNNMSDSEAASSRVGAESAAVKRSPSKLSFHHHADGIDGFPSSDKEEDDSVIVGSPPGSARGEINSLLLQAAVNRVDSAETSSTGNRSAMDGATAPGVSRHRRNSSSKSKSDSTNDVFQGFDFAYNWNNLQEINLSKMKDLDNRTHSRNSSNNSMVSNQGQPQGSPLSTSSKTTKRK